MLTEFYTDSEKEIGERFLRDKHIIAPAENIDLLREIQKRAAHIAAAAIHHKAPSDDQVEVFLNTIHEHVPVADLNAMRLKVITEMNQDPWFRQAYFNSARTLLTTLVGNELAMQRRINFSIQFPNDDSSLLPVHADAWSGDSSFEIVMWVPLVNCYATKSMYLAKPSVDEKIQSNFNQFSERSSEDLFQTIKNDVDFLTVPFGSVLLFSQNVMHGNRMNTEKETRWSMNCRFKSVLTPYCGKKFGEFFEPILVRPATRLGLNYQLPEGFL